MGLTPSKDKTKFIMVGMDAAGKTTILYKLGNVNTSVDGFNLETVKYETLEIYSWDVGGNDHSKAWRRYYSNVNGIIFVVDSSDRVRAGETKEQLKRLLDEEKLKDVALLVLNNKQDLCVMGAEEVSEELGLHTIEERVWHIQNTCALTLDGVYEIPWLRKTIAQKK